MAEPTLGGLTGGESAAGAGPAAAVPVPTAAAVPVRSAHRAVAVVFAVNGALLGTWAPRIPEVQQKLGISHGTLGLVLFALAAGSLTAMPVVGRLMQRYGSSQALRVATVAACAVPGAVGAAGSVPAIWPALFLWGVALGGMDVAMNAQAVTVQQAHPRTVINGIHACFSLGGLLGAATGSAAAALAVPVTWHLAVAGAVGLVCCLPLLRHLLEDQGPAAEAARDGAQREDAGTGRTSLARTGPLTLLCAAAFAAMLAEGATADWSAVRLTETGVSAGTAGLGYTAFALAMLVGRASGDTLARRVGHARMAGAAALLGCGGAVAGFAVPGPVPAMVAFAALGLGLSCLMPFLFVAAGEGAQGTAVAVTAVSTSGYLGLLTGPALIGGLAELSSVATALWLLPALLLLGSLPAVRTAHGERAARMAHITDTKGSES
ncbi:MFS transporter [Streptomyces sparsogenes]|uniref:MFS transporter n=1 Tax=Streptomyces sparsogenes TaxID=67365 RepID=UPI0033E2019A